MLSIDMSKSAPTRSILLMNAIRGTRYLFACRQTVSDCGCTPATASNTAIAPSRTRDLGGEIDVTRRVDNVHAHFHAFEHFVDARLRLLHPGAGRGGRCDRNTALAFLL